ncbi:hypothetical protein AGMMS49983_05920 [Clostridia bacterium]|nr:hypothetical protein AGMMS49983_05920 [Clostridia bacterium]
MKERIPAIIIGFCIPMIAILGLFPMYNRAEPFVFGFPFVYFWLFIWLVITSLCLLVANKIDPYNKPDVIENGKKTLEAAKAYAEAAETEIANAKEVK